MTAPILAVHELAYVYPGGVPALQGLSLNVPKGRKLALVGGNGSGKTTLLLHLNGTLKPCQGQVLLDGCPAAYHRRALKAWRRRIGLVLQEPDDQLFAARVYQDVSFGPLNMGVSELETHVRVWESLAILGIGDLAERATHLLSWGQKKRVAMAGVLAMRPEVLILDEPTAGLDFEGTAQLLEALQKLSTAGATLVFSTHDVDLAYAWADEVAVFREGTVLKQGDPAAILADQRLLQQAKLKTPTVLALVQELQRRGHHLDPARLPRSEAALLTVIGECLGDGLVGRSGGPDNPRQPSP